MNNMPKYVEGKKQRHLIKQNNSIYFLPLCDTLRNALHAAYEKFNHEKFLLNFSQLCDIMQILCKRGF